MHETAPAETFTAEYWENRATKLLGELEARADEVERLRDTVHDLQWENGGLRTLLKSPYQGEYAYDNDAAIDTALAELRAS